MKETKKYSYYSHTECEFFPCHKTEDPQNFNCLFCFCPLYRLDDACGGHFTYTENGITKTALVLVGDVITHSNYAKSRLYAADFETEFRKIKK